MFASCANLPVFLLEYVMRIKHMLRARGKGKEDYLPRTIPRRILPAASLQAIDTA